jgi:hypothetical protein
MFSLSFFLFWLPGAFHNNDTNLRINANVSNDANLLIRIIRVIRIFIRIIRIILY